MRNKEQQASKQAKAPNIRTHP